MTIEDVTPMRHMQGSARRAQRVLAGAVLFVAGLGRVAAHPVSYYSIGQDGLTLSGPTPTSLDHNAADRAARVMVAVPPSGVVVVADIAARRQRAWYIVAGAEPPAEIELGLQAGEAVLSGAAVNEEIYLGTTRGLLRVRHTQATRFDGFADATGGVSVPPSARSYKGPVQAIVADGGCYLWMIDSDGFWGWGRTFCADERKWMSLLEEPAGRVFPVLRTWFLPGRTPQAVAGDPRRPGMWAYASSQTSETEAAVLHVDPSSGDPAWFKQPRPIGEGKGVPVLAESHLLVDTQGSVWLVGRAGQAWRVFRFQGGIPNDVSPSAELLRSRSVTQIAVDMTGVIYLATDGVGVLTFDGEQWTAHPINQHLTMAENGQMRPVESIVANANGSLWIANGCTIACWRK